MFLPMTLKRNPNLIEVAADLVESGEIPPDTYVIDYDSVLDNARQISETCASCGVTPWFISKQYGRVPFVTRGISKYISMATAVDQREAARIVKVGVPLANIGHLVQPSPQALPRFLDAGVQYVTVSDIANLANLNYLCDGRPDRQSVIVKIRSDVSECYPGQQGGLDLEELSELISCMGSFSNIEIAGVTGFPCVLFDDSLKRPRLTGTGRKVLTAANMLRDAGVDPVVNLPSHNSCSTIPEIASLGATHVEPGHALTGTTPEHAEDPTLREVPSIVYASAVVQSTKGAVDVAGGGLYPRGHAKNACVRIGGTWVGGTLDPLPPSAIDYYLHVGLPDDVSVPLGSAAIMAFRTQIFNTRSRVAVVSGISRGQGLAVVEGLYSSSGEDIEGDDL